jgi:hypothetical protein
VVVLALVSFGFWSVRDVSIRKPQARDKNATVTQMRWEA